MSETVSVRVADGDIWLDGEHYTRGDVLDVPEETYERIPRSFERVEETTDDSAAESGSSSSPGGAESVDPHPRELTVDEIRERVEDVTDVGKLKAIRDLEAAGEARSTAIDVLDARIDDLEG